MLLNKKQQKTPFASSLFDWQLLIFCKIFSGRHCQIIQNLDPNKAHDDNNISIRMLKICRSSIYKPLETIFKQCIETGVFPSE